MRRPTPLDWVGATVILGLVSWVTAVIFHDALGVPDPVAITAGMGVFITGVVGGRLWSLRRPENAQVGLTTGGAQLTRLEEVEARLAEMEALQYRVAELEERLDFSERLLASGGQRQPQQRPDA